MRRLTRSWLPCTRLTLQPLTTIVVVDHQPVRPSIHPSVPPKDSQAGRQTDGQDRHHGRPSILATLHPLDDRRVKKAEAKLTRPRPRPTSRRFFGKPLHASRSRRAARIGEIEAKDGLPSADRNNKATLLLTGPFRTAKSSAKDLTPLVLKLQYAKYHDALRAPWKNRLLRR